jgi:hypothetical protein
MKQILFLAMILASSMSLSGAPPRRAVPSSPFPSCASVSGSPAVTFSRYGGRTLAPVDQPLTGVAYTYGLAALDTRTLLSAHNTTLARSTDAGCSWQTVGELPFTDLAIITAAGAKRAYVWADNRESLARYDDGQLTALKPPAAIVGLGVDRAVADHVRVGGDDGTLWESTDGGASWSPLGRLALTGPVLFYRVAFDPANLDHLVFGSSGAGAHVSFDGGRTFTQAAGLGNGFNAFSLQVSPADPNSVWAEGINMAESDANVPSHGRHIFLSRDGGRSFTAVVDEQPGLQLVNGALIAAHPTDPNVLYFVFGTYFQAYGTDLFRYDAAANALRVSHFDYDDFDAIAFSPADPSVMYFGLESVKRGPGFLPAQ